MKTNTVGRPSFLATAIGVARAAGGGGAAHFVVRSGIVLVAVTFVLAGNAGVASVLSCSVSPAPAEFIVGGCAVGGLLGGLAFSREGMFCVAIVGLGLREEGEKSGCCEESLHVLDCGGGGGCVGRRSSDGVGAVVAGRTGCSGATTVFVGSAEVGFKGVEGFVGGGFLAPVVASCGEEAGILDDGVAVSHGCGVGDCVVTGDGEANGLGELVEDCVDGLFGCPGLFHGDEVGFEFGGGNLAVCGPEIGEEFKASEVAPAELLVVESLGIRLGKGFKELFEKCFVGGDVGAVDFLIFEMLSVGFRDLGCCGSCHMYGLDGRIHWWDEGNASESVVGCGGNGEGKVSVVAVTAVGVDGLRIAVELCLGDAECGVAGFFSVSGDGGDCGDWEVVS